MAHAALLRVGRGSPWSASLAFAATDGILWFVAAPLAMALGRRLGARRPGPPLAARASARVAAPLFGAIQGAVSDRRRTPLARARAGVRLLLSGPQRRRRSSLAAVALDQSAARIAMARHSRRFLALEARLLEVRHDLLTLQLQPHFLFNALNSVVELMRESPSEAARVLRDLRTLFLATTQRSSQAAVSLAEELSVVDAFIGVARARHADSLSVTREVDEAALTASVPPLSLQPLVENAIQFALQSRGGRARGLAARPRAATGGSTSASRTVAASATGHRADSGIGLRNTRERLAHLFGADHALDADPRPPTGRSPSSTCPSCPLDERTPEQRLEVTDEFAAVANPVSARASILPRWIGRLPHAGGDRRLLDARVALLGLPDLLSYVAALRGRCPHDCEWSPPDLVSAISWMALTPVALYLARRFPVQAPRERSPSRCTSPAALGAAAVNVGSIVAVFGLDMIPPNNVLNQVVVNCAIYTLLVVLAHAEPIARWFDERQTATRRLQAELARARWEATEMRLSPEIIAGELERLATLVELTPPARRTTCWTWPTRCAAG